MNLRTLFLSLFLLLSTSALHAQDDPKAPTSTDTAGKAAYDADTEEFLKELETFIDSMDVSRPGWRDEKPDNDIPKATALDCSRLGLMLDKAAAEWKPLTTAEQKAYAAKSGNSTSISTIPGPYNYEVRYDPRTKELSSMADPDRMAINRYSAAFEACLKTHGTDWKPAAEAGFFFSPSRRCMAGLGINTSGEVELQVRQAGE